MKLCDIADKLNFELLTGDSTDREVKRLYTCDLLSWVMAKAREDDMWFTVMGNVNAVAVASLCDVSAIVLTENAPLDEDAKAKASMNDIVIYKTELDTASVLLLADRLINERV